MVAEDGRQRVPGCSTGCSIHVDQNEDHVYRLRPRPNPQAQGDFMCDEGRFGWKYMHGDERLPLPEQRSGGKVVSRDWDVVLPAVRTALVEAAASRGEGAIAAVLSPWMTVEEAYLLASYLKSLSANVTLAMGPVRVVGEDDKYPKDVHGRPVEPVKFTIRAEKCPNRRGVEIDLEALRRRRDADGRRAGPGGSGRFRGDVSGRRRSAGLDQRRAGGGARQSRRRSSCRIFCRRPASRRATFVLPGGSFAERDGTFVNHAGLAQEIHRSIRAPGEAKPDGRILWDLAGRRGLLNVAALRREMAEQIAALRPLATARWESTECG